MSKRITDEKLNVEMSINGVNKTQAEISKIQTSIKNLKNENDELAAAKRKLLAEGKKESEQYKELTKAQNTNRVEIDKYTSKQKELQKQIGLTGMTMSQLVKEQKGLKSQMNNFVPGTPEWQKLNRELQETNARLGQVRGEMNQTEGIMGRMKKSLGGLGGMLLGGAGLMAAWQGVKKLVQVHSELSDVQADVRKTSGLTNDEVVKLTNNLKKFNTRTPVEELLKLGAEAGRLGKDSVEDIEAFVRTADMISVALGDDLQGDINENVQLIGKLSTQYKVAEKYGGDFGKGMERVGSAINEVAASGSNQAGFLVDYMKRLVGVSSQTGITADQQIGFAAALDEAGQSVEVSGTTMSKIIVDMYKDADAYAKIAGVSTEEFAELLKTDANEALLVFLEGLKGNADGFGVMVNKMDELKLEGSRSIGVLTALASNTDLVRARQETANKAIIEATSLTDEFNVKNNNLAGNLEKLGNTIANYFKESAITGWLTEVTSGVLQLIGVTKSANEAFDAETKSKVESVKANRDLAISSSKLLEEYESLTADGVEPTEEAKRRLDEITLLLRDNLGESVIAIDKETGALTLNTEAVKKQITAKRLAANATASELASDLVGNKAALENLTKQRELIKKDLETRERLITDADKNAEKAAQFSPAGFKEVEVPESVKRRNEELKKLIEVNKKIEEEERRKNEITKGLETAYFDPNDVEEIFEPTSPTTNEDGDDDKKKLTDKELAEREKHLKSLATLQDRYIKMEEDRLAVTNEEKAVLERDRAVKEAENLRAGQALLNDIKAEHQIKIDEAILKDEEKKLQNIQAFEDRKKELENQIALQREQDEEARDLLAEEQRYEKDQELLEKEMEKIQIEEDQKNTLRQLLKEEHEASITEIETRHAAVRLSKEKEYTKESIRATEILEEAKRAAIQGGLSALSGFFDKKSHIYKALFLMEKGMAMAEVGIQASKSLAQITATTMDASGKAISAFPLTIGQPWVSLIGASGIKQAAAVKLNTALQLATMGATAIKGVAGFEDGLYKDITRTDGKRFRARNMGKTRTQVVNEPSYFNDYLTGEAGPELIVDSDTFRRLDPKVVQHIMDVRHNVRGFESGKYPGETSSVNPTTMINSDPELKAMLATLMVRLNEPINANIHFGYEEAAKTTELQTEIQQSKNNGKLTP